MFLLSKIKGWLEAIAAIIIAFGSAYAWAIFKGRSEGRKDVREADVKASQEAVNNDLNLRQSIDTKVSILPVPKVSVPPPERPQEPSDAQAIGNAQPDTATGKLQNDWMPKS